MMITIKKGGNLIQLNVLCIIIDKESACDIIKINILGYLEANSLTYN